MDAERRALDAMGLLVYTGFGVIEPTEEPMAQKKGRLGGRPKRTDNPQRLVTHLPGALKKRLQHQAVEESRSAGAIITEALLRYLATRERGRS